MPTSPASYNQEEHGKEQLASWMDDQDAKTLLENPFSTVSFNVVLKWEDEYFPNEIGAARYSLQDGVIGRFHHFIDPGKLPTGSRGLASTHQPNHRIPINGISLKDAGTSKEIQSPTYCDSLLNQLLDFIRPGTPEIRGKKNYFVFVKGNPFNNQVSQVLGSIVFLTKRSNNPYFKILFEEKRIFFLDVSTLAQNLMFICAPEINLPDPYIIINACDNLSYEYCPDVSCTYHDDRECDNCALAVAIKVWYCISKAILKPLGIEAVAGKHTSAVSSDLSALKSASDASDLASDIWERSSVTSFRSSSTAMPGPIKKQKYFGPAAPRLAPSGLPSASGAMSVSSVWSQASRSSSAEDKKFVQRGPSTSASQDGGRVGLGRGRGSS